MAFYDVADSIIQFRPIYVFAGLWKSHKNVEDALVYCNIFKEQNIEQLLIHW